MAALGGSGRLNTEDGRVGPVIVEGQRVEQEDGIAISMTRAMV
jgi:hypothetical protein